jgi:hypothetical protein
MQWFAAGRNPMKPELNAGEAGAGPHVDGTPKLTPGRRGGPHIDVKPAYLPVTATARFLGVSPVTVWRAVRAGRIRVIKIGKRNLCDLASIERAANK